MELSLDFGGSTIDAVVWDGDEIVEVSSEEQVADYKWQMADGQYDRIYVTGGKSRFMEGDFVKVDEIDAIGAGGAWLMANGGWRMADGEKLLVVSMGTGTCMASVECQGGVPSLQSTHVGGTGIGGGTFLGLGRELLGIKTIPDLLEMGARGSASSVDLSVQDIVGGGIGRVSAEATASNLGRLAREVEFSKEDLAAGIINLIGQSIGASAAFAARSEGADKVVLIGKLTRATAITDVVKGILESFDFEVLVPEMADSAVAIGARVSAKWGVPSAK